jgi:hypothetical protein
MLAHGEMTDVEYVVNTSASGSAAFLLLENAASAKSL